MDKLRYFLLVIFILEFIEPSLELELPLIPYSPGKLCFIIYGILGINKIGLNNFLRRYIYAFLIWLSFLLGSFFSVDIPWVQSLGIVIASFPYYISMTMLSFDYSVEKFQTLMISFFHIIFIYSVCYVFYNFYINDFNSYSILHILGLVDNRHEVGFKISIASVFLFIYHFNKSKYLIISILIISISSMLIIESRSNILIYLISIFIFLFTNKIFSNIYTFLIVVFVSSFSFIQLSSTFDSIENRFSFQDKQLASINDRIYAIEKFPENFYNNLLGKGPKDIRFTNKSGVKMTYHNQYFTILTAGGLISMFVLIILIYNFLYKSTKLLYSISLSRFNNSLLYVLLNILLIFFTVEFLGFQWFLFFSLLIYFTKNSFE